MLSLTIIGPDRRPSFRSEPSPSLRHRLTESAWTPACYQRLPPIAATSFRRESCGYVQVAAANRAQDLTACCAKSLTANRLQLVASKSCDAVMCEAPQLTAIDLRIIDGRAVRLRSNVLAVLAAIIACDREPRRAYCEFIVCGDPLPLLRVGHWSRGACFE
jgi:hypothetical protein